MLNGKSLGLANCTPIGFASFPQVPYEPGNLTAYGWAVTPGIAGGGEGGAPPPSIFAAHTQVRSGPPAAIDLVLDSPSAATGTGTALVLDGHDAALVRAVLRDAEGVVVTDAEGVMITFAVESGPGYVAGGHNGNTTSHVPQREPSRPVYHGLARAVVKVTVDAASTNRRGLKMLSEQIELGLRGSGPTSACSNGDVTCARARSGSSHQVRIDARGSAAAAAYSDIVVVASSPGLPAAKLTIPVSVDAAAHSALAAATATASNSEALIFD